MRTYLTPEQIKRYIEHYGDGDVYYSHHTRPDGLVKIKFLSKIRNFADDATIDELIKVTLKKQPHLKNKLLEVILISDKFAYIPARDNSNKNPLVINYQRFLSDVRKENQSQYQR